MSKKQLIVNDSLMMQEWDYEENNKLKIDPAVTSVGLNKGEKPYWKCTIHNVKYRQYPKAKHLGYRGCPKCINEIMAEHNRQVGIKRSGTLAEKFPELAEEWDYEKNTLTPYDYPPYSGEEVWWIYKKCGHSHTQIISNRTRKKYGCPFCSGKDVLEGFNDLLHNNPILCEEWDYETNNKKGIFPNKITSFSSSDSVGWICKNCSNRWFSTVANRQVGKGCPKCASSYQSSFHEQALYFYAKKYFKNVINSYELGGYKYDIFIEDSRTLIEYDGYHWHKNKIEIDNIKNDIAYKFNLKLIRLREYGLPNTNNHSTNIILDNYYLTSLEVGLKSLFEKIDISADINIKRDTTDIMSYVKNRVVENNITIQYPEIAKKWHPKFNGNLRPENFSKGSDQFVYWLCPKCGYGKKEKIYGKKINEMIYHPNCPACERPITVIWKGHNDFKSQAPKDLLDEWNYEKNSKQPNEYTFRDRERVYWICSKCGYGIEQDWYVEIYERVTNHTGCPACGKRITVLWKGHNDFESQAPKELLDEWNYEKNDKIPSEYIYKSTDPVYWKCSKCGYGVNQDWFIPIYNRTIEKRSCPVCRNIILCTGINDLKTKDSSLTKWFSKKNDIDPSLVKYFGKKTKYIWECPKCGEEFSKSIYEIKKIATKHHCK